MAPPFVHTPYDGSSHLFSVGLRPIGFESWLEPDALLAAHLLRKQELFAQQFEKVFQAEPGTADAQHEALCLIVDNLRRFHERTHRIGPDHVWIAGRGEAVALTGAAPLLIASCLVQEDLVLMRAGPEGYRLAAASLCFPSSWSLAEKFGQSMPAIHETVPGFNSGRMGRVVGKLFENLKHDQLVCRYNWALYDDAELHHPEPKQLTSSASETGTDLLAGLFIRVERQTLRRLPVSGDILFTIKVHHDPLALLEKVPERSAIAAGLRQQLLALEPDQLAYKGLAMQRDRLADQLNRVANGAGMTS
ncbi:DUF3445 domain-containing protein [Roseibium sp. RKSG952]|nr:DUF3445 domain-containing protein [Roseibium sp. RKSG952]